MKTSEVRTLFLDYFAAQEHLVVPSSSLVPHRDPSVLLTTAGMQQFKPYFMGIAEPPSRRLASVQKCFRTTDIDQVGHTGRHCTFFEMLGNFSVGDYFKKEAIRFGYEFSIEYLGLERDRIWISYFMGDEQVPADIEAIEAWETVGIPRGRMVGLPRSDNFWGPTGNSGPCGPCSELYYDQGLEHGCGSTDCKPGCECERFLEYWNLVFTEYNMDVSGALSALPFNNIDTGMGLERAAALTQNVESVFYTDMFLPLIELGQEMSGHKYGQDPSTDIVLRVLADHSRGMAFLIADGVLPGNEGRSYVLRRVIRRAARMGRSFHLESPFLAQFSQRVIDILGDQYPELREKRDTIIRIVETEEQRFNRTLDQGLVLLEQEIARAKDQGSSMLPGHIAFTLHDTYGFPVEVTRELVTEADLVLDLEGFETAMEGQRARARVSQRGETQTQQFAADFARAAECPTEFLGYERDELFTVVEKVLPLDEEDQILVALRESPFYAEKGGQTADIGWIESEDGRAEVLDVQEHGEVHVLVARILEGTIQEGTRVKAVISTTHRHSVAANHTGTHLLQYGLQAVLGNEVRQAGSAVRPDKFRFDFAFQEPVGSERLATVEEIVNRKIVEDHQVRTFTTTIDHARELGAMMLFDEKYGDFVRVVEIDEFSRELCGGTHVGRTSEIGLFKILSESSVGANVRRIEAVTGREAVEYFRRRDALVKEAAQTLQLSQDDQLVTGIRKLQEQIAALSTEVKELRSGKAGDIVQKLTDVAERADGVAVVTASIQARDMDQLLSMLDQVRDKLSPAVVALGAEVQGKALFGVTVSRQATDRLHAGNLVKSAAQILGGGGGGSPTLGRAGGGDPVRLVEALDSVRAEVMRALGCV